MPPQKPGKSKQDYATPACFIKALEARFGPLTLDLAASETNRKAPLWLGLDKGLNSLEIDWKGAAGDGLCFLNPPFSHIEPWAKKCYIEGERGCKIFFLVPASVGSNWWRDWVHNKAYAHILNGRITFEGCSDPYIKDLALIQYGYGISGYGIWSWMK